MGMLYIIIMYDAWVCYIEYLSMYDKWVCYIE